MNNKSQLLKGSLEGCVLKIIDFKEEVYGYDIAKILKENGFEDISEGTLYPLYTRLQKNGFITATVKESTLGPARKYYHLTEKGKEELQDFIQTWEDMCKNINNIIHGNIG